jgi:GntR family transcriptional regulator
LVGGEGRSLSVGGSQVTDFSTKVPVWYQLAMMLRSEILKGALAPGSRIDPEVQLAARHGVSVMPVRQALRTLEAEGLVTRQRGRGTFVSDHRRPMPGSTTLESLYSREFDKPAQILERGTIAVPASIRAPFEKQRELLFVRRLAFHQTRPWSYGVLYFLTQFGRQITTKRLERYPLYRVMEEHCQVRIRRSQFDARASAATPVVADHLMIESFSPVLNLTAISYDYDDRAVGAFELSFIGDPYVFSFETLHGTET